ncbi:MAG: YbgA family protein [Senegalia sp. (in: firmicutes)]|uniref:YbgA family protein n=1 Tax=Senegalia sp. (in: firmicutes) TaxID=1924098 RepID=UPI003F989392
MTDKPKVVVSKCLGFCECRYNGITIQNDFVDKLGKFVEYITVCPEVGIGLGIPRKPIRLVEENDQIELYQPETKNIYTKKMKDFTDDFLNDLEDVDGFLLKGRSPSCGIKDVKIYRGKNNSIVSGKGAGIFADEVLKRYDELAIEEEGRLTNFKIREHFLAHLYTMNRFKDVENEKSLKLLVDFHSKNKYLIMAHNPELLKVLGRIVANHEKLDTEEIVEKYKENLGKAMKILPKETNYINTLMHIFGYFSDELSSQEKKFSLDLLDKYRNESIPLSVPLNVFRTYAIKYNEEYLLDQTIWSTYPEALMDLKDSGK